MVVYENACYTFGGFGDNKSRLHDLRRYDFAQRQWSQIEYTGDAPKPVYLHTAVVHRGAMYVFGGSIGKDSNDLHRFVFASKRWELIRPQPNGNVPAPRYGHAACVLGEYMYVTGGCRQNNQYFRDAWRYHFATNVWTALADLPLDIAYHSLVAHQDRLLLIYGFNTKFSPHIYTYSTSAGSAPFAQQAAQWTPMHTTVQMSSILSSTGSRQPAPSCGMAAVVAGNGLYFFGGYTTTGHAPDLYRLNLTTAEWSVVRTASAARPLGRAYLQAALSPDGYLHILGGFDGLKCLTDFRRISIAPADFAAAASASGDLDLLQLLRDLQLPVKTVTRTAMKHFAQTPQTPVAFGAPKQTLDEGQVEQLLQNIRRHLTNSGHSATASGGSSNPFGGSSNNSSSSSSSSFSSSLNPSSAAFFPFDTSRLGDLMEFGFDRAIVLECLERMYQEKKDTRNFSLVVETLLNFTSERRTPIEPPPIDNPFARIHAHSVTAPAHAPAAAAASAGSSGSTRSNSVSSFAGLSISSPTSGAASSSAAPAPSSTPQAGSATAAAASIHPPTANASSLQEQVQRLTAENTEMRTCKVCFDSVIDCILLPCAHLVVCATCAVDPNMKSCPICAKKVQTHTKVFWS